MTNSRPDPDPIAMPCDACGELIPPSHAVCLVLNDATLARMHMSCYAAGALWAAKQARGEPAVAEVPAASPAPGELGNMANPFRKPFDGNTPLVSTAAGRKQPDPPGQGGGG